MTREKLEEYLSEVLNVKYYNEEELQKIYDAVKSTVDVIEESIGDSPLRYLSESRCQDREGDHQLHPAATGSRPQKGSGSSRLYI